MYKSIFSDPFPTSINSRIINLNDRVTELEKEEGGGNERSSNIFSLRMLVDQTQIQTLYVFDSILSIVDVYIPIGTIDDNGDPYIFDKDTFLSRGLIPIFKKGSFKILIVTFTSLNPLIVGRYYLTVRNAIPKVSMFDIDSYNNISQYSLFFQFTIWQDYIDDMILTSTNNLIIYDVNIALVL